MITGDRNAGRMNLGIARVGKSSAMTVGAERSCYVAPNRICGKVIDVAVAAGAKKNGVGSPRLSLTLARFGNSLA